MNILNMLYTLRFFSLQNAVCFIMLTCLVPVLFTVYIQGALKLKKNNSDAKGLRTILWSGTLDKRKDPNESSVVGVFWQNIILLTVMR